MYITLKNCLNEIMSNPDYYYPEGNLQDVRTKYNIPEIGEVNGSTKFRLLVLHELELDRQNTVQCEYLTSSGAKKDFCYRTDNEVVLGIPNTDFKTENMISQKNAQGSTSKYLPITIYPDAKSVKEEDSGYMESQALFLGLRADGAMTIIQNVDCEKENHKNYIQCQAIKYVSSIDLD